MTDAELVHYMHSDPAAAVPILYSRFAPRIRRLVQRMLGADAEHNDLVQQVFYRMIERGIDLRDPRKLPAWIHACTAHVVYAEIRRRRVRNKANATLVREDIADLVQEVEARDLLQRARSTIQCMPPAERLAFMLCVVENLTFGEAAALAGCSNSTIRRRLARANQRFRRLIVRNTERASCGEAREIALEAARRP